MPLHVRKEMLFLSQNDKIYLIFDLFFLTLYSEWDWCAPAVVQYQLPYLRNTNIKHWYSDQYKHKHEGGGTMAIIINMDVVMAKRKMTLTELAERVDITPANLSILKTGKAKAVRFSTLEAICRELECQPGDIIEYSRTDNKNNKLF